jgi:DNA-binding beta-propeller fold protein YncE
VADSFNDRIQVFDSNGNFLTSFGSLGNPGQFVTPEGVAVDSLSGNVYVADSGNGRIEVFNSGTPVPEPAENAGLIMVGVFGAGLMVKYKPKRLFICQKNYDRLIEEYKR